MPRRSDDNDDYSDNDGDEDYKFPEDAEYLGFSEFKQKLIEVDSTTGAEGGQSRRKTDQGVMDLTRSSSCFGIKTVISSVRWSLA